MVKTFFASLGAMVVVTILGQCECVAVTIDLVPVGNLGNINDPVGGAGTVAYQYEIGKLEVTNEQYVEFLNGVDLAGENKLALYDSRMTSNSSGGINFSSIAAPGAHYSVKNGRDFNPVNFITWYDSVRFTNWLHNGQGSGSTETGSYFMDSLGADGVPVNPNAVVRTSIATWVLPTENEWHKAAYHKNDGVTGNYWELPMRTDSANGIPYSDEPPGSDAPDQSNTANFYKDDGIVNFYDDGYAVTGVAVVLLDPLQNYLTDVGSYPLSLSPYNTLNQAGNVSELTETADGATSRIKRGGSWFASYVSQLSSNRFGISPLGDSSLIGFRVAQVFPLPGDFDGDGDVDGDDFLEWQRGFGTLYNASHLADWEANYGSGTLAAASTTVPEPSSLVLIAVGLLGMGCRLRKRA